MSKGQICYSEYGVLSGLAENVASFDEPLGSCLNMVFWRGIKCALVFSGYGRGRPNYSTKMVRFLWSFGFRLHESDRCPNPADSGRPTKERRTQKRTQNGMNFLCPVSVMQPRKPHKQGIVGWCESPLTPETGVRFPLGSPKSLQRVANILQPFFLCFSGAFSAFLHTLIFSRITVANRAYSCRNQDRVVTCLTFFPIRWFGRILQKNINA